MKILRTDGGGENSADERLKIVRSFLNYFPITKVDFLHDHKGNLTVTWNEIPDDWEKNKVVSIWALFGEEYIEHKLIKIIDL